ncbi:MAG: VTT domain-containing protein [Alphaproteobacteria bacterium]|nr:VTT domain-containing protein [Alphaproteobacteria bacterium]
MNFTLLNFIQSSFHWSNLLQPQFYIQHGGLIVILLVIFAETGLFVGFFLPGDSLLFVTGIYVQDIMTNFLNYFGNNIHVNEYISLILLIILISIAGILGNIVGYGFGFKVGSKMYDWKDSTFFKQKYLKQAQLFYEKYGVMAIVAGRFLPFVRTFAPIIAGIVKMNKSTFVFYNILGCFAWVGSMLLGGFFIQKWLMHLYNFDLTKHLELIVIGIVVVTTFPVVYKFAFAQKKI